MSKAVIVTTLILMLTATGASANLIGLFADQDAIDCSESFPVFNTTDVYVIAVLSDVDVLTAAEFRIDGLPQPNGMFILTQVWNSSLTIGDPLGDGMSIAFTAPQSGPIVILGTLTFFPINPNWQNPDSMWCITETLNSHMLMVVDGDFSAIPCMGWCFVADCNLGGPYGNCECLDSISTAETNWGSLKMLY